MVTNVEARIEDTRYARVRSKGRTLCHTLFGNAAPSNDAWVLAGLRIEEAHVAKLVKTARSAERQFKRLKKRMRAKVRRRSRALWRAVKRHVQLRSVAWFWWELPSRSTRFEAERCMAIASFEKECALHAFARTTSKDEECGKRERDSVCTFE